MTEHSDFAPMPGDVEGSPGFDLVRRGYDPHQVNSHVAWLMEQLREAEAHRAAAEAAASEAAAEAARIRDDLALGRPAWDDFGGRITQILMLAEEEAAAVRAERTRDADNALEEARHIVADAEHTRDRTLREADEQAAGIVSTARGEAEHIIDTARTKAHKLEDESQARLAELERQRDQVTAQLGALRNQVTQQLSALQSQLAAATAAIDLPVEEPKAVPKAGSRI